MTLVGLDASGWTWLHEPPASDVQRPDAMTWTCAAGSDFWRLTAAGYIAHDGTAYVRRVDGNFDIRGTFDAAFADRYDQVGFVMLRSATRWVKVNVELDGTQKFGSVATHGESDWAWEAGRLPAGIRVRRAGSTVEVDVRDNDGWRTCRQLTLPGPVDVGPYAASPTSPGFESELCDCELTTSRRTH